MNTSSKLWVGARLSRQAWKQIGWDDSVPHVAKGDSMRLRAKKEKYFHGSDLILDDDKNDYFVLTQWMKPDREDKRLAFKTPVEAASFLEKCLAYMEDDYFLKRFVCEKLSERCLSRSLTEKALKQKTAELLLQSNIVVIPKRSAV